MKTDTRRATRVRGLSKHTVDTLALGFGSISFIPVGRAKFKNNDHKGYKVTSEGVVIGYSDSLENIANLKVLLSEKAINGSSEKLKFIGAVEIDDSAKHLFDLDVIAYLKQFKRNTVTLKAGDIKPRKRRKASWKA